MLFRSAAPLPSFDGTAATSEVIATALLTIGFDELVGPHTAFINFNRELLLSDRATILPPQRTVIEVLEDSAVDDALIESCCNLRKMGYLIAIDDYIGDPRFDPLIPYTDIIKIDLRGVGIADQHRLVTRLRAQNVKLLAEKVETPEEFHVCSALGFDYFQGYFFARPVTITRRELPANKIAALRVLREANRRDIDLAQLEAVLRQDPSLCYKLLRYVNSAAFGFSRTIDSIKSALILIGDIRIRQWVSLAVMRSLGDNKPQELVTHILTRARFCESIALLSPLASRSSEFFLMGMFSLFDALVDRPLAEILAELHVSNDVRASLLTGDSDSVFASVYALVRAYEHSDWDTVTPTCSKLGLTPQSVCSVYVESVRWASAIVSL
ncbi:MAG: HDOD domain-containing protein [Bryobacterales bacterium]|nr:HDOD domain-containing protein [Bryobacterales bacterium]